MGKRHTVREDSIRDDTNFISDTTNFFSVNDPPLICNSSRVCEEVLEEVTEADSIQITP